jgi:hypothetical protein
VQGEVAMEYGLIDALTTEIDRSDSRALAASG